jgi:hypothetical protein
VNNAPDLSDPDERLRVKAMVHAFANNKHAIGDDSVQFWLHEMELYYASISNRTNEEYVNFDTMRDAISFYGLAMHYFSAMKTAIWPEDVVWGPAPSHNGTIAKIKAFRLP